MTNIDYTKHDPDARCTPCDDRDPRKCSLACYVGHLMGIIELICTCDCHAGFEKEEE